MEEEQEEVEEEQEEQEKETLTLVDDWKTWLAGHYPHLSVLSGKYSRRQHRGGGKPKFYRCLMVSEQDPPKTSTQTPGAPLEPRAVDFKRSPGSTRCFHLANRTQ